MQKWVVLLIVGAIILFTPIPYKEVGVLCPQSIGMEDSCNPYSWSPSLWQRIFTKKVVDLPLIQDQTTNWKTYTDPRGRFEFKYPSELTEYKSEAAIVFNKSGKAESPYKGGLQLMEYDLNKYEFPEGLASEDGLHKFDVNKKQWVFSKGSSGYNTPKRIDGETEAYVSKVGGGLCAGHRIIILEPSYTNVTEIVNTVCLDSFYDEINIDSALDQRTKDILSTFKFL